MNWATVAIILWLDGVIVWGVYACLAEYKSRYLGRPWAECDYVGTWIAKTARSGGRFALRLMSRGRVLPVHEQSELPDRRA